jgi:SAM-dependent methyltransferase
MVSCSCCRAPASCWFHARDYNRLVTTDEFAYYKCSVCGLLFLAEIPENLGQYYPKDYYAIPRSLSRLNRLAEHQRYRIELVQEFVPSGQLLDIGPSFGVFAHLAKRSGFEVQTIEMDERCCRYLREVVGVDVIESDDPAAVLSQLEPPQVITLWHIVEHLPDPWLCLQRAADLLEPGGILVVATPNPQSRQFGILHSRWLHIDAPRHLQLIPADLLRERLNEFGLEIVMITSDNQDARDSSRAGWIALVAHLVPAKLVRRLLWRAGRLAYPVVRPIAEALERGELNGSSYTLVARKMGRAD